MGLIEGVLKLLSQAVIGKELRKLDDDPESRETSANLRKNIPTLKQNLKVFCQKYPDSPLCKSQMGQDYLSEDEVMSSNNPLEEKFIAGLWSLIKIAFGVFIVYRVIITIPNLPIIFNKINYSEMFQVNFLKENGLYLFIVFIIYVVIILFGLNMILYNVNKLFSKTGD